MCSTINSNSPQGAGREGAQVGGNGVCWGASVRQGEGPQGRWRNGQPREPCVVEAARPPRQEGKASDPWLPRPGHHRPARKQEKVLVTPYPASRPTNVSFVLTLLRKQQQKVWKCM